MVHYYRKTPPAVVGFWVIVASSLLLGAAVLVVLPEATSAFVVPSSSLCCPSAFLPSSPPPETRRFSTTSSIGKQHQTVLLEMVAKDSNSNKDNNDGDDDDGGPIFYNDFEDFEASKKDDDDDDDEGNKNDEESKNDAALRKILSASSRSKSSGVDDDDMVVPGDDETAATSSSSDSSFSNFLQERAASSGSSRDWTAIQTRQFFLGQDLVLSNYVGTMGFDEVTDWEYYLQSEDGGSDDDRREVVQPNPLDPSKPKRTRTSSGSVVRIFRGEFVGQVGGVLSSQGLDRRLLVKEFTGDLALALARAELDSLGRLQSDLIVAPSEDDGAAAERGGEWMRAAAARSSTELRRDCANVAKLVQLAARSPFLTILGEVNLAELEGEMDPNEFYRALGVPPPKPGAVWVVYEYGGLSTMQAYSQPAEIRRASLPSKKGFFGNVIPPPPLPAWRERANYVVNGIMKGAILALAKMHESGIVHRSIGRSSFIISTKSMDKREAISPYNTQISNLSMKLADFGFSGPYEKSTTDEEFCVRARSFGMSFRKGVNSIASHNFAIAEDMHALGFVFLGLLLNSLAELPDPNYQMPATDEDTLQRLLSDIFNKNFDEFREYVEAEDIWSNLVQLLDENNGAGWKVLETLVLAREKAAKNKDTTQLFSIRGLLSNPFFSS